MTTDEKNYLLTRLTQSEDQWTERKPSFNEKDIRRTVVGFANSVEEGQKAILFVGADNNGMHKGVSNADEVQRQADDIVKRCYPPIKIQIHLVKTTVDQTSVEIVAIIVPFSSNRPHFAGPAYVRIGSKTVEASPEVFRDLVASQNDKARRILQFKGRRVCLCLISENKFRYDVEGIIEFCDALTVRHRDNESVIRSFAIERIEVKAADGHDLIIVAPPDEPEQIHIRTMIRRWSDFRSIPSEWDFDPDLTNNAVRQVMQNPSWCLETVSNMASAGNLWVRHLLMHMRFEIKKSTLHADPNERHRRLHRQNQGILAELASRGWNQIQGQAMEKQAVLAIESAASVSEAKVFLEELIRPNPPQIQQFQREWFLFAIGMPQSNAAVVLQH